MSIRNMLLFAAVLLALLMYLMRPLETPKPQPSFQAKVPTKPIPRPLSPVTENPPSESQQVESSTPAEPETVTAKDPQSKKAVLPYHMENGLMVVQGDTVVGVPRNANAPDTGYVVIPPLKLWRGGIIPFHIQPNVPNPERVLEAIAMFDGTAVHFVPQSGEDNVLVFEQGDQDCLSYVGQMGGKQPVWISGDCRAPEIAHEILHALGFVHEQNRADRDTYIEVNFDGIDERYADNFEKLSPEFMKVSGLGEFDFNSLMIYPPWMFAKNGQSTMQPKLPDKLIAPSTHLSPGDIERLNSAYGGH